jgi:hypothetical protein
MKQSSYGDIEKFAAEQAQISPVPCDFKVGDKVTYTNEYGVVWPGKEIIGFRASIDPDFLPDRFIYIDTDGYWFPKKISELKHESTGPNIPACDYTIDMDQH